MRAIRNLLEPHEPRIWALFRIVTGFLYACHGAQKLFGVLGGETVYGRPIMVLAGVIEFGGGSLVLLGLLTSFGAFVASGEMMVAYFWVHAPKGVWPILNRGEAATFFAFAFLLIAARGAGVWSLDQVRRSRGDPSGRPRSAQP